MGWGEGGVVLRGMANYDDFGMMDMLDVEEILEENRRRNEHLDKDWGSGLSIGNDYDPRKGAENFAYWAEHRAFIKNKKGGPDIPFVLNPPQRKLVEALEEMRRRDEPIRLILLKARQWGGSTCIQLYMAWLQLIHKTGLNSLILAHQGTASDEIKDMVDRLIESYPQQEFVTEEGAQWEGKKMERVGRSGSTWRIPARKCKIKLGTAERPDACRGGDYSLVHLSEVGLWRKTKGKRPEDIIRSALSGVLYAPYTMIVLESTANGTGNYFHTEYLQAMKGKSQFRPLFVAWYEIPQYRIEVEDQYKYAEKLLLRRRASSAEDERSESGSYLWELWQKGATLEGIAWYERERAKYSDHEQMASEYPSDDDEAFAHSGARVFSKEAVNRLREECRLPVAVGGIQGETPSGPESLEEVRFVEDQVGSMKIWEWPDKRTSSGDRYLVAVDVGGRCAGADWSVIAVFDRLPLIEGRGPEVVAQWKGHIDIDLLAWKAARIARYYCEALLVIESNTVDRYQAQANAMVEEPTFLFESLKEAYPNLYMRNAPADSARENPTMRYGFHTNRSTKSAVIHNLIEIVREGGYTERDEDCLGEFLTYEQRQNGSYGAIEGKHDDMLMTRAIGLYVSRFGMDMPRIYRQDRDNNKCRIGRKRRPDLCF